MEAPCDKGAVKKVARELGIRHASIEIQVGYQWLFFRENVLGNSKTSPTRKTQPVMYKPCKTIANIPISKYTFQERLGSFKMQEARTGSGSEVFATRESAHYASPTRCKSTLEPVLTCRAHPGSSHCLPTKSAGFGVPRRPSSPPSLTPLPIFPSEGYIRHCREGSRHFKCTLGPSREIVPKKNDVCFLFFSPVPLDPRHARMDSSSSSPDQRLHHTRKRKFRPESAHNHCSSWRIPNLPSRRHHNIHETKVSPRKLHPPTLAVIGDSRKYPVANTTGQCIAKLQKMTPRTA